MAKYFETFRYLAGGAILGIAGMQTIALWAPAAVSGWAECSGLLVGVTFAWLLGRHLHSF